MSSSQPRSWSIRTTDPDTPQAPPASRRHGHERRPVHGASTERSRLQSLQFRCDARRRGPRRRALGRPGSCERARPARRDRSAIEARQGSVAKSGRFVRLSASGACYPYRPPRRRRLRPGSARPGGARGPPPRPSHRRPGSRLHRCPQHRRASRGSYSDRCG